MKRLTLFIFISTFLPHALSAQTFSERAAAAYLETDKNFDIDCYYNRNKQFKIITPAGKTKKTSDSISRDFVVETSDRQIPMHFSLVRNQKTFQYNVLLNEKHLSVGTLAKREFYITPLKDQAFAEEFETSRIYCEVNFAYAYPYLLTDGDYHFSVHPHKTYDWQSRLKTPVESYLNNPDYKSIILLETGNYRGNLVNIHSFLDGIASKLPHTEVDSDLENVPADVPLIVSPAGNNRFDFKVEKEINVTFSGGNHNYCIWNATRHVIEGLMFSKSEAKVNFYYDTSAIVAQIRGVEGMRLNFPRRDVNRSNLLKDLFKTGDHKQYHQAYLNYFSNYIAERFAGMYKTYTIHYKAEGYSTTVVRQGNGTRHLEVTLNYL